MDRWRRPDAFNRHFNSLKTIRPCLNRGLATSAVLATYDGDYEAIPYTLAKRHLQYTGVDITKTRWIRGMTKPGSTAKKARKGKVEEEDVDVPEDEVEQAVLDEAEEQRDGAAVETPQEEAKEARFEVPQRCTEAVEAEVPTEEAQAEETDAVNNATGVVAELEPNRQGETASHEYNEQNMPQATLGTSRLGGHSGALSDVPHGGFPRARASEFPWPEPPRLWREDWGWNEDMTYDEYRGKHQRLVLQRRYLIILQSS